MAQPKTNWTFGFCIATAFLPLAITAWGIHTGMELNQWAMLFNPINAAAFLWLGLAYFHYRRTRTKAAAWIFALFPIAFAEPFLLLSLWISVRFSPR
jgi:hypothetical protein